MSYRKNVLKGLGFEISDEQSTVQEDGPGNDAWQRAQRLALEANARGRRN